MVRELNKVNLPDVVTIWNENSQFLTSDGKTHTLESMTYWYDGKHYENHEYYGFFLGEALIGFCITKEDADISWIKMYALSAENQNKGFGSKCLREIENKLLKNNIQCEVKESNRAAYSFFIKNGYEEIDFDDEYKESILQKLKN